MPWWLSEYHLTEVLDSKGPMEVPAVVNFDSYAVDIEGEGDWDPLDLTGGPNLCHPSSIPVDYDQL